MYFFLGALDIFGYFLLPYIHLGTHSTLGLCYLSVPLYLWVPYILGTSFCLTHVLVPLGTFGASWYLMVLVGISKTLWVSCVSLVVLGYSWVYFLVLLGTYRYLLERPHTYHYLLVHLCTTRYLSVSLGTYRYLLGQSIFESPCRFRDLVKKLI